MKVLTQIKIVFDDQTKSYIFNSTVNSITETRVYYVNELKNTIKLLDLPMHVKTTLHSHVAEQIRERIKTIPIAKEKFKPKLDLTTIKKY